MAESEATTGRIISVKPDLKSSFTPGYVDTKKAWNNLSVEGIESMSRSSNLLNTTGREHGLVTAVRIAFAHHVPLQLGPEHIWTLIIHSVSKHIEKNAEKFRDKFVNFDGKQTLVVRRDGFVKGHAGNDWAGCFKDFSGLIESFIGKENKDNLCPTFSTQTPTSKAVAELSLMDCMKSYFSYEVMTRCGISKVCLTGTPDDWRTLRKALEPLREFDLGWWVDILAPILDNLAASAAGEPVMEDFWQYIYKFWDLGNSGCHPTVDGWISNFFLYINDKLRSRGSFRSLDTLRTDSEDNYMFHSPGVPQDAIPTGITKTPFVWQYHQTRIDMTFYGGFVGAAMKGEFVTPVLGWAVGEKEPDKPQPQRNDFW